MNSTATAPVEIFPRWLYLTVALPLGLLFLTAGAAKTLEFSSLTATIGAITGAPEGVTALLALTLISTEILGGLSLTLKIRPRIVATAMAGLMGIFLLVLHTPGLTSDAARCNCFGPLLPEMSHQARTSLDLFLLGLLVVLALSGQRRMLRVSWIAAGALTLPATVQIAAPDDRSEPTARELTVALEHAGRLDSLFARAAGNRAVLLLDFADFTCSPCYDDILQTVSTLSRGLRRGNPHRAVILIRRRDFSAHQAELRARRWRNAAGFSLPTSTIPDSLFASADGARSSVAIFDERGVLRFHKAFPLQEEERHRLVRLVFPPPEATP